MQTETNNEWILSRAGQSVSGGGVGGVEGVGSRFRDRLKNEEERQEASTPRTEVEAETLRGRDREVRGKKKKKKKQEGKRVGWKRHARAEGIQRARPDAEGEGSRQRQRGRRGWRQAGRPKKTKPRRREVGGGRGKREEGRGRGKQPGSGEESKLNCVWNTNCIPDMESTGLCRSWLVWELPTLPR